jgi:pyridoxal phosphate phosphatase PHOSPHO2
MLVVWDFDWSLVNENTDTYVVDKLSPDLRAGMSGRGLQWTDLCAATFKKMHDRGVTRADFESCLASLPMFDEHIEALRLASESGARQAIISDSNTFFIDTILSVRGLTEHINGGVVTNPSSWTADGALHVDWLQPRDAPHACPWSPPNMCKGNILQDVMAASASETEGKAGGGVVLYVGDGRGDISACLRMRAGDHILARRDFALLKALTEDPEVVGLLKATVHPWGSGEELLGVFKTLISSSGDS